MAYPYGSHMVYKIKDHFAWITKYLYTCGVEWGWMSAGQRTGPPDPQAFQIRILKGVVSKDHVHLLVSPPLSWSPTRSCVGS